MITAPDIDDPCNDENRDLHVRNFKQYPPTDDGTVVYRMSAGPWGRIEQRAGGQWVLVNSDGRFTFNYGIGPSARDAVLSYIDRGHRFALDAENRYRSLDEAKTPQELYSCARIRADQIVKILNSVGSAPTATHDDFRACPPEIMAAVIGLTRELLDAWEQSVDPNGGDPQVGQVRARVAPRIAALEERWADRHLPRF